MFSRLFRRTNVHVLNGPELQSKIDDLQQMYMPLNFDSTFHQNKLRSINKLNYILQNSSRASLQASQFGEVVVCSLAIVYYFGMRLKLNKLTSSCAAWLGKRQFHKAEVAFQHTMVKLNPECSEVTIKMTLEFFTEVSLWPFESFVAQILDVLLFLNKGKISIFNLLLTDIHNILFSDFKSARHRIRVLYDLLKSDHWVIDKQTLLPFITRLLNYFGYSLDKGNKGLTYKYLRKGFEVCLRRIFERADNRDRLTIITTVLNWFSMISMNDDDVLQFSLLVDRVAELYHVNTYCDSFNEGLINHVLKDLVGSPNALCSLMGCRLLQRFLDRKSNATFFEMPKIYYEFSQVRLVLGTYDSGDKSFIAHHREKLHHYFLSAVRKHCHNLVNLKALYSVICCLVMEVPCGLTAAATACIAMSIQDFALNGPNLSATCRYWMHGIVISVMSLICWVHKASVLYCYVNEILARRAKEAPQLNPPLQTVYYVRNHHVNWNKSTLFFEDWELRYGLWKHFKDSQHQLKKSERRKADNIPNLDLS